MQVKSSLYAMTLATKGWRAFEDQCQADGLIASDIDKLAAEALAAQLPLITQKLLLAVAVADDDMAVAAFGEAMDRTLAGDQDLRLLLEVSIICLTRPGLHALVSEQLTRLLIAVTRPNGKSDPKSVARRAWLLAFLIGTALRWPAAVEHLTAMGSSQLVAWTMRHARELEKSGKNFDAPSADDALIIDSAWYARYMPGDHIREPYRDLLATKGVAGLDFAWIAEHLMKSEAEVRELFPQLGSFRKNMMEGFNTSVRDAYLNVFTSSYPTIGNSGALLVCLRSFLDVRNRTFHKALLEHQRHTLNPEPGYFRRTWKRTTVLNRDFESQFFDANLGLRFIAAFEYAHLIGFPYLAVWMPDVVDLPFGEIFHGALDA